MEGFFPTHKLAKFLIVVACLLFLMKGLAVFPHYQQWPVIRAWLQTLETGKILSEIHPSSSWSIMDKRKKCFIWTSSTLVVSNYFFCGHVLSLVLGRAPCLRSHQWPSMPSDPQAEPATCDVLPGTPRLMPWWARVSLLPWRSMDIPSVGLVFH